MSIEVKASRLEGRRLANICGYLKSETRGRREFVVFRWIDFELRGADEDAFESDVIPWDPRGVPLENWLGLLQSAR
jgi:hypothetical protein